MYKVERTQKNPEQHVSHMLSKGEKELDCSSVIPKSSFQIKVKFTIDLEIKVPEAGGRMERHINVHIA